MKPSLKELCRAAAAHFRIPVESLTGDSRLQVYAWPRQMVMFLGVEMLKRSTTDVAEYLGGRDHTTVMYGAREVARAAEGYEVLSDLMVVAALATSYAREREERTLDLAQDLHAGRCLVAIMAKPKAKPKTAMVCTPDPRIFIPARFLRWPHAPRRLMPSDLRRPTEKQLMGARA